MQKGKIVGISISDKKGVEKHNVPEGNCVIDVGIEGDAHSGNWHRMVSLLGQESIDKMIAMGVPDLSPGKFAENITTEGIVLYELPIGTRFTIGSDAEFAVTQIGKECHQHCAIFKRIGDCVMPREGIFARVIKPGVIRPGDDILIHD